MGRLSKRTLQCRAARRSRDLKREQQELKHSSQQHSSTRITTALVKASSDLDSAINFNLLCDESLLRYQRTYGLGLTPGSSKEDLVWAVQHHFKYQEVVDEGSVLYGVVQALKKDSSSDSSNSSFS